MKRTFAFILILALLLSFTACGVSEDDVIGAWLRETVYLESYGCNTDMIVFFGTDGICCQLLQDHDSGKILSFKLGTYELKGFKIVAEYENDYGGTTTYKYFGRFLKNGDYKYTRSEEAEDFLREILS